MMRNWSFLPVLIFFFSFSYAQKPPLDHEVYDGWESLGSRQITDDGRWIGYTVNPQEGDAELFLYHVERDTTLRFQRGTQLHFAGKSEYAVFLVRPFYKDLKAVNDKKMKEEKLVKDSLFIVNLTTLEVKKRPDVKSFQVPEKGKARLACLVFREEEPKEEEGGEISEKKPQKKKEERTDLLLIDPGTGEERKFAGVTRYLLSEQGNSLAFVTADVSEDEEKDAGRNEEAENEETGEKEKEPESFDRETVHWVAAPGDRHRVLVEEKGKFIHLSFSKDGEQLAFVGTTSAKDDLVKDYQLYYYGQENESILNNQHPTLPEDWVFSEHQKPEFSKDGDRLFFGVAPRPVPKDTSLNVNDHAVLDVWSYKDDYLQSVQLSRLQRDLEKSYLAMLETEEPADFRVLADEEVDKVNLVSEGNAPFVLGYSDLDSRIATQWRGSDRRSYYLIDIETGDRTRITEDLFGYASASPGGRYIVYFDRDEQDWFCFDTELSETSNMTEGMTISFADELWDMPDAPRAYGIAGWTDQDESVIIRDRYDLWEFFPDGSRKPRNITGKMGRQQEITFETYRFDPEKKSYSRHEDMYISAFDQNTKDQGLYRIRISEDKPPEKIFTEPVTGLREMKKAKETERYIFVKSSYEKSPDLYVTTDFRDQKQLTRINTQQENYNWGTNELVHWKASDGRAATGILYKPEDFDPGKKYPMIVYFYERLSDGLHTYVPPTPTPSRLNISFFVSNGYLVFAPDIAYTAGYPGRSAANYINSGVEFLKQNPWVDGERIGIQGQSWGGYQVAYLITVTDMYAAAWSGAPVVNMTSAYGGIRWGTGMNRQFQYEKTQSRIGGTLWEDFDLYIENSPLFHLNKVNTPVVIMANDADGAVPWWQGIEMFTALRRLGKPVWMLNYNGDEHNLMKRQNRKDIQRREQQFFDHYLKGARAPVWMTRGIPATMKGKTWGFELTDEEP